MNNEHKKNYWYVIGTTIALIAFAVASFSGPISKLFNGKSAIPEATEFKETIEKQKKTEYNFEQFKKEVKVLVAQHNNRNAALYEKFKQDVEVAGDEDFSKALNNVDPVVKHFSSFKVCGILLFTMARDKIQKTNKAQEMIFEQMNGRIIIPCAAGATKIQNTVEYFMHQLQENDNKLRSEFAQKLNKLPANSNDFASAEKFLAGLEGFNSQVNEIVTATAFTAVGTAIEAICIKYTFRAIVALAGKTVAKLAGSAAAAIIDGPLPIGDVIAIVGLGWCAYDIYKITKILPDKMRSTLNDTINDFKVSSRKKALKKGEEMYNAYVKSSAQLSENMAM